jgi:tetratricopeptide (TPR) repeat protein
VISFSCRQHSKERIEKLTTIVPHRNGISVDLNIFDPALAEIKSRFSADPVLQSELAHSLAEAWFSLGRYQKALAAMELALGLRTRSLGADDRRTLHSAFKLAQIHAQLDNLEIAKTSFEEVIRRMRKELGLTDTLTVAAMNKAASLYARIGNLDHAESLLREIIDIAARNFPQDDQEIIEAINNMGGLMFDKGNFPAARKLISQALEARRQMYGDLHLHTLNSMNDLSLTLKKLHEYPEANQLAEQALEGYQKLAGKMHPDTLQILANFANSLEQQGLFLRAEAYFSELVKSRTVVFGSASPQTLRAMIGHARALNALGRYAEAEQLLRNQILNQSPSKEYQLVAHLHLAVALARQKKSVEAASIFRQILASEAEPRSRVEFQAMSEFAQLLSSQGEWMQAESLSREAAQGLERLLGDADVTLMTLGRLADILRRIGKSEEASLLATRLLDSSRRTMPPDHPYLAYFLTVSGRILASTDQLSAAEAHLREAWQILGRSEQVEPTFRNELHQAVLDLDERRKIGMPNYTPDAADQEWRQALARSASQSL